MHILHITPELPFAPGGGGGETREFYLLRRLVELGHEVENVSPVNATQATKVPLLEAAGVRVRTARRPESRVEEVLRAAAAEPAPVTSALATYPFLAWGERVIWTRLRPLAQRAISERRPDVIAIGHDMAAHWVRDVPADVPAVLTCHNLSWHLYGSGARIASGPRKLALLGEAARYRAHVVRLLPRFRTAVAVSTTERDELEAIGRTRVELIPNGVSTAVEPSPEPRDSPPRLLFTGTMSYPPNRDGIVWFADKVWPRVRERVPDAELDVVGRNPPPPVQRLDDLPGITVHGAVPEMEPFFARANVVVAPILTGAGTRVKIVEAMAAGRATVSTPLGAEGLDIEPGRHLLVADGPGAFADATVRLLRDADLRARIGTDARSVAERQYDWRALGDRFAAVLEDACT